MLGLAWSPWLLLAIAGLRLMSSPPSNLPCDQESRLVTAAIPGLSCVSLRYSGTGSWLLRRCPALPHGSVLSALAPALPGCSRGVWPGPALGGGRAWPWRRRRCRRWTGSTHRWLGQLVKQPARMVVTLLSGCGCGRCLANHHEHLRAQAWAALPEPWARGAQPCLAVTAKPCPQERPWDIR